MNELDNKQDNFNIVLNRDTNETNSNDNLVDGETNTNDLLIIDNRAAKSKKKRKLNKRKEKDILIDSLLAVATKLSKEQCMMILSSIADGTARDFTGLPPSLETRIKAIDKLMPMIETEPSGQLNSITVNIVDSSNTNKIEELERKILNTAKENK
jgi:Pyruvate/2-oxoacid:ferredoxin oxidoreductase gamma subunit